MKPSGVDAQDTSLNPVKAKGRRRSSTGKAKATPKKGRKSKGKVDLQSERDKEDAEKQKLAQFSSMALSHGSRRGVIYRTGETIVIRGDEGQMHHTGAAWIGAIVDIRAETPVAQESTAWCLIQWFYSPEELRNSIGAKQRPDFDHTKCSPFERILTSHTDWILVQTIEGHVEIIKYDESSIEQPFVGNETYFYRKTHYFKRKNDPPPARCDYCLKNYSLNPDTEQIMRFCPRYKCRKWHHVRCLAKHQSVTQLNADDLAREFEHTLPITDEDEFDENTPLAKRPRLSVDRKGKGRASTTTKAPHIDTVPDNLRRIAQMPICKGLQYGIVGHLRAILDARRWCENARKGRNFQDEDEDGDGPIPADWERRPYMFRALELLMERDNVRLEGKTWTSEDATYKCAGCNKII